MTEVSNWIPPSPTLGCIFEAPGDVEVSSAERMAALGKRCRGPVIGPSKNHFDPILEGMGVDRWSQIYMANVLPFKLDKNKIGTICVGKGDVVDDGEWEEEVPVELRGAVRRVGGVNCGEGHLPPEYWPYLGKLYAEIRTVNPRILVAHGRTACWALLGTPYFEGLMGHFSEAVIPRTDGTPFEVMATFHPASCFHTPGNQSVIEKHLRTAWEAATIGDGRVEVNPTVYVLETVGEVRKVLGKLRSLTAVDIETYYDGHPRPKWFRDADVSGLLANWPPINPRSSDFMRSIQFAENKDVAYVVNFSDELAPKGCSWGRDDHIEVMWEIAQWLQNPTIPKVFQRGQFDVFRLWEEFRIPVKGWVKDTIIQKHSRAIGDKKDLNSQSAEEMRVGPWKFKRGGKKED